MGGVMLMLQCKLKCRPLIMNITGHIKVNIVHGTVSVTLSIKNVQTHVLQPSNHAVTNSTGTTSKQAGREPQVSKS